MRAPIVTLKRARRLRRNMTLPEVLLWQALRNNSLCDARFRRQYPFGPYILDFYCTTSKLAVEVDGAAHDDFERAVKDRVRDRSLADAGIKVLRFNARDVLDEHSRPDVLDTIAAAMIGVPRRD